MNPLFWEGTGGKISEKKSRGLEIKASKHSLKQVPQINFATKSSYIGQWDKLGMRGYGYYSLFYGVDYDGNFFDGLFSGLGTFLYQNNSKIDGYWENGHMQAHRYFFADGLSYGPYCQTPDRRFYLELKYKLKPAGRSLQTNSFDPRPIPEGCYDTGDGFYHPKNKCVYDVNDPKKIVRIPTKEQHEWIIKNCRKAWDEPAGYNPELNQICMLEDNFDDVEEKDRRNFMRKSVDYFCYRTHV